MNHLLFLSQATRESRLREDNKKEAENEELKVKKRPVNS